MAAESHPHRALILQKDELSLGNGISLQADDSQQLVAPDPATDPYRRLRFRGRICYPQGEIFCRFF